jgi:XTP/dITP diphosphohydrolase
MTRVVAATGNAGKLGEIRAALAEAGVEVTGIDALTDTTPIEETGTTYEENARLKAEGYSRRTEDLVLADDSGLEVEALEGAPGIYSARYGSPTLSDRARCRAILKALIDTPEAQRGARFVCVIAIARGGTTLATFRGEVPGTILREMRGEGGFGYDPIFFYPPLGRAFGELTREEKQQVSHRGVALRRSVSFFTKERGA